MCLFAKRLERGRFIWPSHSGGRHCFPGVGHAGCRPGAPRGIPRPRTWPPIPRLGHDPGWDHMPLKAPDNDSLRLKRKVAAWDDDFLASLIAHDFFTRFPRRRRMAEERHSNILRVVMEARSRLLRFRLMHDGRVSKSVP